ncbi:MAG TPA: glycosyltransferase [Rhodobacteraceae bacterium]|nr:glycosyltransferase [Paracoccaceae bacterium]
MAGPRVLHIHFGKEGGAERFFVALTRALDSRGVEQRFIIRGGQSWEPDIAALGPVIHGNFSHFIRLTGVMQLRLWRLCRQWRPDGILAWMPRAARLLPAYPGAVKAVRLGDFPTHLRYFGNCDVVVGNIPAIGEHVRNLGWTGETRTISNFPRPVVPQPVSRAAHDTPEDAFLVVAGGRFVPRKGMDVALRAVAQVPGAWLWLLGTGGQEDALKALAAELGISDRVRFVGWVPEAIHHIAAGDAFVMPSRHEPLGNMLLEAWRAGVPSISTRSEGPDWYMHPGVDGILTEIDDVDAIAAGLERLRANPGEARAFSRNAAARLDDWFSEDAVCAAYIDLFRNGPRGHA